MRIIWTNQDKRDMRDQRRLLLKIDLAEEAAKGGCMEKLQ